MKDSGIYYSLGALLYTAADNTNIIDDIIFEKFNIPFSLAFSFDTTSNDAEADKAENVLVKTLDKLFVAKKERIVEELIKSSKYKSLEAKYIVDESILGGIVIRIGDRVVDSSVKTRIEKMRKMLS